MRVLVAMSGGVDSSVVAHLLKEQGHELVGVRFTLWSDPLAPAIAQVLPSKCCTTETIARAKRVAAHLGIPLHIVDLEAEFKREVVDPFLEGHRRGTTPNPCIRCNRTIKFGKLIEIADAFGCEKLATGHYARLAIERLADGERTHVLLEAIDAAKDQSYYLYGLSQSQLQRSLFPLGSLRKREVFALARHYGVALSQHYRESQDLCFFPEKTPTAFLKRHLEAALKPGPIVRRDGTIVGTHSGLPLYTVGQRHGLRVGGLRVPLEVIAKDVQSNRLIVADRGEEQAQHLKLSQLHFISWKPEQGTPVDFECRTRSLAARMRGRLTYRGSRGAFSFASPAKPQTPGQSLVLYRGAEVVGGGVIG